MPTVEELQAELETKNKELTEVNEKVKSYQDKLGKVEDLESFTSLKTDRDNLKSKVKTFESEIETLKKGANGDEAIKKLLADRESELAQLNSKLSEAEKKAQKADALEADIVRELMSQLPDDADIKSLAEGMEIPKLRLLVKKHSTATPPPVHGGQATGDEKKLNDKQLKEAAEMFPFSSKEKQVEYYIHAKKIGSK